MRINNYFIFIILLTNSLFSQELTIKGKISDQQNRGIQNASVSLLDEKGNF